MSEGIFAIGHDELQSRPRVAIGDRIACQRCAATHALSGTDDGRDVLMVYQCGAEHYLAAIGGQLLPGEQMAGEAGG